MNHDKEVPFRLLKKVKSASVGKDSQNLIIHGDNLEALKALMPYYGGKVKCIYIDPPYNTGNENWIYNDKVNSPKIKKWLGKVVGGESEDLCRHDKWLCMMFPRLKLLRDLLSESGVIFVSIDETEAGYLRVLMDEVFGRENSLGTFVWKRRSSSAMRGTPLSIDHEYVLCYGLDAQKTLLYGLEKGIESYPFEDKKGHYASTDLTVGMSKDARPGQFYSITNPKTGRVYKPNPERVWRFYPETMQEVIKNELIIWPDDVSGRMERPRYKTYYNPNSEKPNPVSTWIETTASMKSVESQEYEVNILSSGMNQEGGKLLQQIFGTKNFAYPKPVSLVASLVKAATKEGDLILDSFAGSGTTGDAVLKCNKDDTGNRKFILIEMEDDIAKQITAERIKRSIEKNGYKDGFEYCELDKPLFNETGHIEETCDFDQFATYIYFTETQTNIDRAKVDKNFIGELNETEFYLIYKEKGKNILDKGFLKKLRKTEAKKIVYADNCTIDEKILDECNVLFKQIPYEVKIY